MKAIHVQRATKSGKFGGLVTSCVVLLLCAVTAIPAPAATKFKSLLSFNVNNGLNPVGGLVQGLDGNLYGVTQYGGANRPCNAKQVGCGTVLQITPTGGLTTLYSFCTQTNCTDGAYPLAGLVLATNGDFYGTTSGGGANGGGTIFKITSGGKFTIVYNFCAQFGCADGLNPGSALVQGVDGNLYGLTILGGIGGCGGCHGGGTFFKITLGGKMTKLYDFCTGSCLDGNNPANGLVQAADGNFYGTVTGRSGYYDGRLFKLTPAGKLTVLYNFCSLTNCPDGAFPYGPLVQGVDNSLYGTTSGGGTYGDGTVFKITTAGKLTTVHSFDYETSGNYGASPFAGLVLANDGTFYGTTFEGGTGCVFGCGTVFKMTPTGKMTSLYLFTGPDGSGPLGLFQDTSGTFFGVTSTGGANNEGTIFSLSDGLKPFVYLLPSHGKVGGTIDILGQGLTGSTSVSFNGTTAKFNVVASTYLTAIVPAGATSGAVTVKTPTATLISNLKFLVQPEILSFSPTSGAVGTPVTITGNSFTGATKVTFGGVKATFTVKSDTEVDTTVPTGAVTGKIALTTPNGTTVSSGVFTVTQ